jgi:hypothetical protein
MFTLIRSTYYNLKMGMQIRIVGSTEHGGLKVETPAKQLETTILEIRKVIQR